MTRLASLLSCLALPILLSSCHDTTQTGRCTTGILGDPSLPMQLEPIYIGEDGHPHDITACGALDIVKPPQGGRVLFVGVRATNLDACAAKIDAALRDPETRGILGSEIRTFNLTPIAGRPGWGESGGGGDLFDSGFADFANMTMCPNVNARDVQRQDGLLEINVTDRSGRKGKIAVHVIPRCNQQDAVSRAECDCTCEAHYTMDKCRDVMTWPAVEDAGMCPASFPDGGAADAGSDDAAIPDGSSADGT